jgi:stage II sporulation protein E
MLNGLKKKSSLKLALPKGLMKNALFLLLGFLAGRTVILDSMSPFGAALVAAAPPGYILAALIGAGAGGVLSGSPYLILGMAKLIAAAGIRWALSDLKKISGHKLFPAINSFASVLLTSIILNASIGTVGAQEILLYIAEALMAGGAAYFFCGGISTMNNGSHIATLAPQELSCLIISYGILIIPITEIAFYGVSPGRILMVFSILIAARCGREAGGAIAGIAAGVVMSLADSGMMFLAAAYAFGGLVSGIFARFGKLASAAAFIAASCVIVITGGYEQLAPVMGEIALASVVFALLPAHALQQISGGFGTNAAEPKGETVRRAVLNRLESASKALSDISDVVLEVSDKLDKLSAPDISGVMELASEDVCNECGLRAACWKTCIDETKSAFEGLHVPLTSKGKVELEDLPDYLKRKCAHPNEIMLAVNRNYMDFTAREGAKRKVAGVRAVINDQFSGVSDLLGDLAKELKSFEKDDKDSATRLSTALRNEGFTPIDVMCKLDSKRRMSVDIRALCFGREVEREELLDMICLTCGRGFEEPLIEKRGEEFKLRTVEKVPYEVEFGASQHSCGGGRLCGDTYEYYQDGKGRAVMLISDGMGTGGRAAIDSAMASNLMTRMLKGGFSFDCSLKIVNSALLVKCDEETLATLDISCLDLYTGNVDILKAGAPLTLIRRGNKIIRIDTASLPAGILREVEFERSNCTLAEGDVIMMFSDGAIMGSLNWMEQELLNYSFEETPQDFSRRMVEKVCSLRKDGHDDDVTILTAIIKLREEMLVVTEKERSA